MQPTQPAAQRKLIIIFGQEGAGKTTTISRLVKYIPQSAQLDAENVGQVNPWVFDDAFLQLLWKNVLDVTYNFWAFGYHTVITGSFFDGYAQYLDFRKRLPPDIRVTLIHLCASKAVRDQRRAQRPKVYNKQASDWIDAHYLEDQEFREHAHELDYFRLETSELSVEDTIALILEHLQF
jgi:hypothetical protein